uniref:disease resistance-like protein DSC1 n=1 Tax=Erigeron canadensis TaxID=72917 RepID=UPI001CB8FFA9|nr:disease resistance-like protein DSC1 [Erigeron canadensis]
MTSLETLILSSCKSLKMLPEVSPCMEKLSKIYLDQCGQIEELPPSITSLSGLSLLNLTNCTNLKNIPNSICELKNLKSLHLHNCGKLQKVPEDFKSMQNLEELLLGLSEMWDYERLPDFIGFHTVKSLFCLKKLDLSWRQIEEKDFPQNLHAFSHLEELHLSGNSRLTQLPAGISDLPRLKLLELNKCDKLQNLHSLPSGIQVLKARGCRSLEKIGDLTKEYEWLYKIWLLDCHKLLECQETEGHLDKMLHQSFLKKCAAVNHRLSIAIPGTNMPSWLKEEWYGCSIVLKLPPKCHTQIMGFAVCGVFHGSWQSKHASPRIIFKIVNDEKAIPIQKVVSVSASAAADNGNVWISYIPFDFFQQMYHDFQPEDWSHIEGTLVMTLMTTDNNKSVRCAAQIVYREDLENLQPMTTCISDYGNLVQVSGNDCQKHLDYDRRVSGNTYVSQEKSDEKNSNQIPVRSGTSRSPFMYDISAILCK